MLRVLSRPAAARFQGAFMNPRITAVAFAISLAIAGTSVSAISIDGRTVKQAGRPTTSSVMAATDHRLLVLTSGIYDPAHERLVTPAILSAKSVAAEQSDHFIVQFDDAAMRNSRDALERAGAQISGYLPHNAYLVRFAGDAGSLHQVSGVRFVGAWEAAHKLAPDIVSRAVAPNPGEFVWVNVIGFEGDSAQALEQSMRSVAGSAVIASNKNRAGLPRTLLQVPTPALQSLLPELAAKRAVAWIELFEFPHPHNADSVGPIQGNASSAPSGGVPTFAPIWAKGLLGTGQIGAVADSGLDRNEGWFTRYSKNGITNNEVTDAVNSTPPLVAQVWPDRKVYGYFNIPSPSALVPGGTPYDNGSSWHGTHTSGTVVGDAGTASTSSVLNYQTGEGMAPNAQILFQDIGNDQSSTLTGDSDTDMWLQARNAGAFVSSNSYGSDNSGMYNSSDAGVDRATFLAEDLLIAISAGNDNPGLGQIGHPAHAKNALTVGALGHGNSTLVASFSNWGPASDGRRKPDIQAPGTSIVSARGDDIDTNPGPGTATTRSISGTSMSCPTVAGGALLMRQYFYDGVYPSGSATVVDRRNPLGAEMKAVLLNGTAFLPVSPDNTSGWGRMFLDNNLFFTGDPRDMRVYGLKNESGLRTGDQHEYRVQVNAGSEFRATLVWNDPPGALGTGIALVNNLDLEVLDGAATLYRGNNITGVGPAANTTAGGTADTLNNVEQVLFIAPTAGVYTVRVKGTAVPGSGLSASNRQGYGLAISSGSVATTVTTAPSDFTVANQAGGVLVTASVTVPNADAYQVYRAPGTCAAADPRSFQYVGTTSTGANTFLDTGSQGGYTYAYRVRGASPAGEGPVSVCKEVQSTQPCTLVPTFNDTSVAVSKLSGGACGTNVSWAAGMSNCPAAPTLRFNVYRSTDPFFTPAVGNKIATVNGSTSFNDTSALSLTTYYYSVRAEDATTGNPGPNGGNETNGTTRSKFTPSGLTPVAGTFFDGAESPSHLVMQAPWYVSNARFSAGTLSYRTAQPGQATYSSDQCATLTGPDMLLTAGATLTYKARYDLELNWDGVVTEISTNGGSSWAPLPPTGGFPSSFSATGASPVNACGYAATQTAFSGTTGGNFNTFTTSLAAFVGQTVRIRWKFSSDPGAEEEGFYLDEVSVTNGSSPGMCLNNELMFQDGFE
jgi:hypothetical protein